MRRYFPGRVELLVFAILAVICGAVVAGFESPDAALSLLAFPVFVFAAVLELWKSGRLRA
jgi:hypothetical protein